MNRVNVVTGTGWPEDSGRWGRGRERTRGRERESEREWGKRWRERIRNTEILFSKAIAPFEGV